MKTQVIQLDVHDDVISVRDKMSWAKTPRLLLVFPRRGRILARTLDLRLLQRHAAGLGAQLAIVTRSAEIGTAARELKIPVFDTSVTAQRQGWPEQEPALTVNPRAAHPNLRQRLQDVKGVEGHWRNRPAVRLGFFTLAVLAVLTLLLLFVPSARIKLSPRLQTQSLNMPVTAGPDTANIDLVAGSLPPRNATVVVEGSETTPASGSALLPDQPARGQVRFRNLTTSVIGIPAGTVVQTTGSPAIQFATTVDGVAAAGVGKTVDLPVRALDPGSAANLPADQLIAIVGGLGTSLSVTNPAPTVGGTDRSTPVATAGDRLRLHEALLARLKQQALAQIPNVLAAGDVLFPDSLTIKQVLAETYIPGQGQPGDKVTLNLKVEFEVQYAKGSDLQSLASAVMNADLPAGYLPVSGSVEISIRQPPITASGVTQWEILAVRTLRARIDGQQAVQMIQGVNIPAASRKLFTLLPLSVKPEIHLFPSWWPWLPWLSFRITAVTN
jgi:hypothetical protein